MTDDAETARLQRAAAGYVRFRKMRSVGNVLVGLGMAAVAVVVIATHGLIWGLVTFFIGGTVVGGVLGVLVMLPLGYLICGRDAMTFGRKYESRFER